MPIKSHSQRRIEGDQLSLTENLASDAAVGGVGGDIKYPTGNAMMFGSDANLENETIDVIANISPFDVWMEGRISQYETENEDGHFGIIHVGADYLINPELLLGVSVQGDWTDLAGKNADNQTEGFGFLLTPYVTSKSSEGFYFDARVGWGRSYNKIAPFGTSTDSFNSERWIASAALIGTWNLGNFKISPKAELSYFKEKSEAYVDSLNVNIPSVEIETGLFEFGPTISRDFVANGGAKYSPFLTVEGIWTFSRKNSATLLIDENILGDEGGERSVQL